MPTIDDAIQSFLFSIAAEKTYFGGSRSRCAAAMQTWRRSLKERSIPPNMTPLDALSLSCVREFAVWLEAATYQPRDKRKPPARFKETTIHSYQFFLRHAISFWHAQGWLPFVVDPANTHRPSLISAYAARRHAQDVPLDFGFRMMAAAMSTPLPPKGYLGMQPQRTSVLRTRALIAVLCTTGLPLREVCCLTTEHLQSARQNNGDFSLRFRSTGAPVDCVLSPSTLEIVNAYLADSPTDNFLFRNFGFYVNSTSTRLSEDMARVIIKTVGRLAYTDGEDTVPLPSFCTPRAFRHWFARNAVHQGVPLPDLQRMLGHANALTTRIVYGPDPITASASNANKIE